MATRWGFCSAGKISNDFCSALKTLPESEHQVVAVAAREEQSAKDFAQKYNIPSYYGSYLQLAQDPNVEIVYIGAIHPYHLQYSLLFLEHGKHVLCEKPVTMNLEECKLVLSKAKEKKLFFMEGFWTRFFPVVKLLKQEIQAGLLGKINFLRASFCVSIASVDRVAKKELGGGGLMDIGCYLVQYANLVFQSEYPDKVVVVASEISKEGIDVGATLVFHYKNGGTAVLFYHVDSAIGSNTLTIHGSKGNIQIPDPYWCPTTITFPSGESKHFPLPDSPYTYNFVNSVGFTYQAQAVRECLQKGLTECPEMTHQDSIQIMSLLDEAQKQMGVKYTSTRA